MNTNNLLNTVLNLTSEDVNSKVNEVAEGLQLAVNIIKDENFKQVMNVAMDLYKDNLSTIIPMMMELAVKNKATLEASNVKECTTELKNKYGEEFAKIFKSTPELELTVDATDLEVLREYKLITKEHYKSVDAISNLSRDDCGTTSSYIRKLTELLEVQDDLKEKLAYMERTFKVIKNLD